MTTGYYCAIFPLCGGRVAILIIKHVQPYYLTKLQVRVTFHRYIIEGLVAQINEQCYFYCFIFVEFCFYKNSDILQTVSTSQKSQWNHKFQNYTECH